MTEIVKRWTVYVVAVIILLVAAGTCVNRSRDVISGEKNVYEKQLERRVKQLKTAEKSTVKYIDSLNNENKKKDKEIEKLKQKNVVVNSKISKLEKDKQSTLTKISKNTYKQSAEAIAKEYKATKSVSYDDSGVNLKDSVPNKVVQTIVEKEFCEEKQALTETKLANTEKVVTALESKVLNGERERDKLKEADKEKDLALEAQKDFNKATEKENRSLKRGRIVDKVLIVAAFIGGILIGK